jgi:hypothetical protein
MRSNWKRKFERLVPPIRRGNKDVSGGVRLSVHSTGPWQRFRISFGNSGEGQIHYQEVISWGSWSSMLSAARINTTLSYRSWSISPFRDSNLSWHCRVNWLPSTMTKIINELQDWGSPGKTMPLLRSCWLAATIATSYSRLKFSRHNSLWARSRFSVQKRNPAYEEWGFIFHNTMSKSISEY